MTRTAPAAETPAAPLWPAVLSLSLGVFGLVGAEFLPASLLTPMAGSLGISEGMAGQAVTATAAVGLVTSLLIASLTRRIDRRVVVLAFSAALVASNLVVALAPNLAALLLGRVLLGFALGGFWALSTANTMRLVPEADVPKALAIVVSGVSAATIFSAPVGSFVGDLLGWRAVFVGAAGLGALAFVVQAATLPAMPASGHARLSGVVELLARPRIAVAMLAILLVFGGQMALFTYVRPFLDTVTGAGVGGISAALLAFGVASFAGNYLGGILIARSLRLTLAGAPLAIGLIAFALATWGGDYARDTALIALWGLAFGTVPVGWSAWIARTLPDSAETGGGLLVATINLAIATGAAAGGLVLEAGGVGTVFLAAAVVLVAAATTALAGLGAGPAVARPA